MNTSRDLGGRLWVLTIWGLQGRMPSLLIVEMLAQIVTSWWGQICCDYRPYEHPCYPLRSHPLRSILS